MMLNLEESAEAIVRKYGTRKPGRAEPKEREESMRSRDEQRKQPTSYEGSRQRVAVKPQGYAGAPSSSPVQVEPSSRGELRRPPLNRQVKHKDYFDLLMIA